MALLWLVASASAQIPKLAEIPSGISATRQTTLAKLRAGLLQRRGDLASRVSAHNGQCGVLPENSPKYASCAAEQVTLEKDKSSYIADVRDFNRQVGVAVTLAANPSSNVVDLSDHPGPLIVDPRDLKPRRGRADPFSNPRPSALRSCIKGLRFCSRP